MAREAEPLDLDAEAMPELARLAREVARTGRARVLRENGVDIAVIAPATPEDRSDRIAWKKPTPEQIEAALASAGGWKGLVDPEEFKRQRRELQVDDRPQRDW